jgi:hypothetical protein
MNYIQEMWRLALETESQGIFFWAGVYAFVVCAYSVLFQIRTRSWPVTDGELVQAGVRTFGTRDLVLSNQDYVSKALYHYRVSGVAYDGTRVSPWIFVASHNMRFILEKQMSSIQQYPSGKVKVFYNPKKPQKSYLIIAGKVGIVTTSLIGLAPLVLYVFN